MKISLLINKLIEAKEKHGDIEAVIEDGGYYSWGDTDLLSDFIKKESEKSINVFDISESKIKTDTKPVEDEYCIVIGFTNAVP